MVSFRERRPFLFCALAIGMFLALLVGASYGIVFLHLDMESLLPDVICELLECLLMLMMILWGGLGYVLKRQGNGFGSGVMAGAYFIVIGMLAIGSGWSMMQNQELYASLGVLTEDKHFLGISHVILFVIFMIAVGMAEEFLYRAIVAEVLIHRFGASKAGIMKAAFLTGILFGATHMVNARVTGVVSATVQALSASVLGIVLTLAFYISGNLWSVVFLHAFVDFSGMFYEGGVYGTGSLSDLTASMQYTWINLVGVIPYVIVILVLLRKRSILRIQAVYGESDERVDQVFDD